MKKSLLALSIVALLVGIDSCGPKTPPEKAYSVAEYTAVAHERDSVKAVAKVNYSALATARNDLAVADSSVRKLRKELKVANNQIADFQKKMQNFKEISVDDNGLQHVTTFQ